MRKPRGLARRLFGQTLALAALTAPVYGQIANAWSNIAPNVAISALAIDPDNPNTIYAGTVSGVLKSTDGGTTWINTGLSGDIVTLAIDFANPGILYAAISEHNFCFYFDQRLFKSTDAGMTWKSVILPINGCMDIYVLLIDPTTPTTLYVADYGEDTNATLIKSTDGGETWGRGSGLIGPPLAALAIDPHNPTTLYSGTFDYHSYEYDGNLEDKRNGVLKSTDGGVNWTTTGLTNTGIAVLAIDPVNPSTIYAATSRFIFTYSPLRPGSFGGLFKSTDGGSSWSAINSGLSQLLGSNANVTALAIRPDSPNVLYAGTNGGGVFRSTDGGANWGQLNDGLTNLYVQSLALAPGNSAILYAGTSAGIFKIVDGTAGTVASVSAASFHGGALASESIAASFGVGLATATMEAVTLALPTELAGTTVKVKDGSGTERLAPLFFVSPTQVNYQIPPGTVPGAATVTITSGDGSVSTGVALLNAVAPSLFTANQNGDGVAAAVALRVKADGSRSYEEIAQFDAAQNGFIARPLDLGPEGDQVFLILFGTGIRFRSSLSQIIGTIGGAFAEVSYAAAQPDFVGLDQVNVLVPRSLAGRGELDVLLTVEAQMANAVRINIK